MDPYEALQDVRSTLADVRDGTADPDRLLDALTALRLLRAELSGWEPDLITAARAAGTSWTDLAPALGVASRQAAERRYLRLRPSVTGETTGEARVDAQRDRRAGDRAVALWARDNAVVLRKLAGRVSSLQGLTRAGQHSAGRVGDALADDDPATLLPPLAAARRHLDGDLAEQVGDISAHTDRLRRDAATHRRQRNA
jgi:hypothetical protein